MPAYAYAERVVATTQASTGGRGSCAWAAGRLDSADCGRPVSGIAAIGTAATTHGLVERGCPACKPSGLMSIRVCSSIELLARIFASDLLAAIQQQANELSAPFLLQTVHASRTVMRSPAAEWFKLVCRHGACLCHAECVLLDSPGQSSLIVWQRCRQQQPPRQSQKWNRDHIACRSI